MDDSASVLTGQVRVIVNPASMRAKVRAFQASVRLCVNMTVMMPLSLITRRHSTKISCILE